LPKAENVPHSDKAVIATGMKVTRARLAVRALAWLRPSQVSAVSSPHTHIGVLLRTGPSIWGWLTSIWISMVFSGEWLC
jgi:hypothetical protein